jgi:phosphocarrier protein HPr
VSEKEVVKSFTIKNKLGLHARAAAVFVRLSSKFNSDIKIFKDGYEVDGKSILGVLSLAAIKGSKIEIVARGEDSEKAMNQIEELVESGFGEGI